MENKMTKLTAAFFDSIGLKYGINGDNSEIIETGLGGFDNISSVRVIFFFDDNEHSVHLIAPQIVKVPESKKANIYRLINEINQKYRWVKFYMNSEGNVMIDADCILDMETCGQECLEIMQRTADIANDAYPILMREIWN